MKHLLTLCAATLIFASCAQSGPSEDMVEKAPISQTSEPEKMDHSKIVTGNGENNFIILDGASRDGTRFTFPEVTIDKAGFLVMHPFRDGKPVQTEYVGAVPLVAGTHSDVDIRVEGSVNTGDNFIVMLHYDMNTDQVFDFNDGITVPDAPVFEGHTLVALRYTAP